MSVEFFGCNDPKKMPEFLLPYSADFDTAVKANIENQNCSICPRYWYVDMSITCKKCREKFVFNTSEQRIWYEKYKFWIESIPTRCKTCRKSAREEKSLRKRYDEKITVAISGHNLNLLKEVAEIIDKLYEIGDDLPTRINENRKHLSNKIRKLTI